MFLFRLTVQKEGPNKGRQFYGCSKPRDSQCGFFQWADEDGNNSRGGARGGGSLRACVQKIFDGS